MRVLHLFVQLTEEYDTSSDDNADAEQGATDEDEPGGYSSHQRDFR
jgi:hypothetical protein